jgi:copper(I)-binding protein
MIYKKVIIICSLFIYIIFHSFSFAENIKLNGLIISDFWIKESIGNSSATSGYITIKNNNEFDDYLVKIKSNISNKSEIHQMIVENDIMKMKSLLSGIKIKAKSTIYLKPGANHIMFMKLQKKIKLNSVHQVNLVFQKAGNLILNMPVYKSSFAVKGHKH